MAWNLDITPTLQMIRDQNALSPFTSYIQGQQAGMQQAVARNQLDTYARQAQARQYAPAAMQGDQNAIAAMAALDPQAAQQSAQYAGVDPKTMFDRVGGAIYAADTPEKMASVQAWAKANNIPNADKITWDNRNELIGEHQTISQQIEAKQRQQNFELQQQTLANQARFQNAQIGNMNFDNRLKAYEAGGGWMSGQPVPQPGAPQVAAPSAGATPTQAPAQGGIDMTQAQPIPQPMQRPQVTVDANTGKPNTQAQAAYLASLPPAIAPLVQQAANYNLDLNKIPAKQRMQFDAMVSGYDPSYNPSMYAQRMAMNKAVQTGTYAQTINSADKVVQHLALLSDYANALNNGNIPLANSIKNAIAQNLGMPEQTNFNVLASGAGTELAKAMKGTGTVDVGSINEAQNNFSNASSPAQIKGAIKTAMHMLSSAIDPISTRYQEVMGKPLNWASPRTQAALTKLGLDPSEFGGASPTASGYTSIGQPTKIGNSVIQEIQ